MSEDKPSRPNGSGTDPMQRLASLKPSRDLSLGAAKPNKKVFLPNLNVARNKNKGPTTSGNQGPRKEERHRRDKKNDRDKNFRGPNVIKSTGVFSEGLASAERNPSRMSYGRATESERNVTVIQKPTIRVRNFVKIDKELEDQKIRSVMGEGHNEPLSDGPSVDFKKTKERDAPIKLPMDNTCWSDIPTLKVKQEVIVKSEPEEFEPLVGRAKLISTVKREPPEETEVVNLLKKNEPTLILLQLPDTLPGRGGGREEEPRRRVCKAEPSTSTTTEEAATEKPVDNRCYLSDLEEGRIGTIRTHRSGRVTLLLGDTVFEVNMGTKPAYQQEVVSASCDASSRSAALVSLGALQHKLSIVPHWETMFRDIAK